MTDRVNIPAGRYLWALQRAGMTVDDYERGHQRSSLSEWLNGTKAPTFAQLEAFAKSVNVPMGFLFLEQAPKEEIPFPVFRGEAGSLKTFDLNVYDTICSIQERQEWLQEYLSENEITTCEFVGCSNIDMPVNRTVSLLRKYLHIEEGWVFGLASSEAAVSKITDALEEAGVFVAYNGVVGNNTHRKISVGDCRGFALVDDVAPYIFINSSDAPTAQLFTLIHEAAHLALGISAGHAAVDTLSNNIYERYCDMVAAEFLVPSSEIRNAWDGSIKNAARKFRVSELVIARRAHDLALITDDAYRSFWTEYKNRPAYTRKKSGGGSFYRTSVKRIGRTFAIHVKNAVRSNQLSYTEAFRLTGLRGSTYSNFMSNNI